MESDSRSHEGMQIFSALPYVDENGITKYDYSFLPELEKSKKDIDALRKLFDDIINRGEVGEKIIDTKIGSVVMKSSQSSEPGMIRYMEIRGYATSFPIDEDNQTNSLNPEPFQDQPEDNHSERSDTSDNRQCETQSFESMPEQKQEVKIQ